MTRDLELKLVTLVFGILALVAMGACSAAGTTQNAPEIAEPRVTSTPEPEPTITATAEPQPTPEATEEPAGDAGTDHEATDHDEFEVTGKPAELHIDKIDVSTIFEHVGLTDDGAMDVPEGWDNVAWYEPGTLPGSIGNAVVAGHFDSPTGPAIFYELNELDLGDHVTVVTDEGEELTFEVIEIELVHADEAPLKKIFGESDDRNLNLITCDGIWDRNANMYDQRLIVYTTLVGAQA